MSDSFNYNNNANYGYIDNSNDYNGINHGMDNKDKKDHYNHNNYIVNRINYNDIKTTRLQSPKRQQERQSRREWL